MATQQEVDKYIEALNGITHNDWMRLKAGIDRAFDIEIGKLERNVKLANKEVIDNCVRWLFECTEG